MTATTPVYLLASNGQLCDAALHTSITPEHLTDWFTLWKPYRDKMLQSVPRENWPQHPHWNWVKKSYHFDGELAMRGYAITCRGRTQGLMWIRLAGFSKIQATLGKPLIYIEYIESAPWNVLQYAEEPLYKGIGSILLKVGISLSIEEEYKGRIGLHSLRQAELFYLKNGLTDMGVDADHHNLRYFEMTEEQARCFLSQGENNA